MSLAPGVLVSHYKIVDKLGEGGMGVVWRALDTTLGREVALKVLPEQLSRDPERLARFEREAKLLAALSHPNIAAIYQLESADGVRFLAMELTGGEDLASRLARGPLPPGEALRIARDVADALEAAHERGIVHRDLKPSNIMVGTGTDHASSVDAGRAKVLDFGLAKAIEGEPGSGSSGDDPDLHRSQSPTLTGMMTGANVILGTAAYMSPEQARGQLADKRADVWSFGVVLFEMLAGKQLFEGETISDTLASVLKNEIDWSALPTGTPARVRTLLRRCLERDRRRRLRDIGEARIVLDDVIAQRPDSHVIDAAATGEAGAGRESGDASLAAAALPASRRAFDLASPRAWGILALALAIGAIAAMALVRASPNERAGDRNVRKLILGSDQGGNDRPRIPVVSPDGTTVAYVAGNAILIRRLDTLMPRSVDVGGGVERLFWSPDGTQVGFILGSRMGRIDARSGAMQTILDSGKPFSGGAGASWRDDGTIVFSRADSEGLLEVSARGGDARATVPPDSLRETDFHDPFVLPGNRGILFVPHRRTTPFSDIEVWDGKQRKVLISMPGQTLSWPVYAKSGHILFARTPTNPGIWAVPFSLAKLEATGDAFLVAPAGTSPSVTHGGTLVYREGSGASGRRLVIADRTGVELSEIASIPNGSAWWFSMSPDFERAAYSVENGEVDLWIADVRRGTRTRLTFTPGNELWSSWSPSGDRLVYQMSPMQGAQLADHVLRSVAADGTGSVDSIGKGLTPQFTPDGQGIVFGRTPDGGTPADLAYYSLADRTTRPLFAAPSWQADGHVSPDGRWIAYMSGESGGAEIFLRPFPAGEGRWQISTGGGNFPRWNKRGDRLYYVNDADVFEVDIALGSAPSLGTPKKLFTRVLPNTVRPSGWSHDFAVSADGARFAYYLPLADAHMRADIVAVENWIEEFEGEGAERR